MAKCIYFMIHCLLLFKINGRALLQPFPVEMISNIVQWFDKPSSITAYICNILDSAYLIKKLSENGIFANVFRLEVNELTYPSSPDQTLFILDISCQNNYELVLLKADQLKLFSSPFRWIIINQNGSSKLKRDFDSLNILIDSEIMITNINPDGIYSIHSIFKRAPNLPLIQYEIGIWKPKIGLVVNEKTMSLKERRNLMGIDLKSCIVITNNDTLNHLTDKRDKHIDTITKVNYILVQHLGDIVNATLKYSIQNTWGYKNNDSEWSGMIGELQRKEADIGGTALFLTSDRVPVIDYIAMTTPTRSKFVFRQPKLSYVTNVYVLPFHWSVWIASFVMIVITAVCLYGVTRWDWYKRRLRNVTKKYDQSELRDSWLEIIMLAFGAMCQQGAPSIPYSVSGRIITIFLFVSLMFLYTSYSANIVALLQSSSNSIQTLNDLLHSRLDVGVDDTVFNHFYFPNASEPVRQAIYQQKVAPSGQAARYFPISEGVQRMRHGHFAFHMETGAGYKIVSETFEEHEKCGLQEIQYLQVPDPWLAIQKNSSYKKILKIGLRKIQESGLQSREVSLLYTKKPTCISRGSTFVSVGIIDCYLAAAVLFGGILLSFFILLLEILLSCKHLLRVRLMV